MSLMCVVYDMVLFRVVFCSNCSVLICVVSCYAPFLFIFSVLYVIQKDIFNRFKVNVILKLHCY